jgi:hypothetical protein
MTTTTDTVRSAPAASRTRSALRFTGHYLEMVLAMGIGMVVLAPLWRLAWPALADHPDLETITMVLDMTVAMALWMCLRGHGPRHITRMCVAMDLGFVLVLPAYWLGLLSAGAMEGLGHALMLLLMALAMLPDPFRRTS